MNKNRTDFQNNSIAVNDNINPLRGLSFLGIPFSTIIQPLRGWNTALTELIRLKWLKLKKTKCKSNNSEYMDDGIVIINFSSLLALETLNCSSTKYQFI